MKRKCGYWVKKINRFQIWIPISEFWSCLSKTLFGIISHTIFGLHDILSSLWVLVLKKLLRMCLTKENNSRRKELNWISHNMMCRNWTSTSLSSSNTPSASLCNAECSYKIMAKFSQIYSFCLTILMLLPWVAFCWLSVQTHRHLWFPSGIGRVSLRY